MKRRFHWTRSPADAPGEVQRELDAHLELKARELEAQGMDPATARREAAQAFGDRGDDRTGARDGPARYDPASPAAGAVRRLVPGSPGRLSWSAPLARVRRRGAPHPRAGHRGHQRGVQRGAVGAAPSAAVSGVGSAGPALDRSSRGRAGGSGVVLASRIPGVPGEEPHLLGDGRVRGLGARPDRGWRAASRSPGTRSPGNSSACSAPVPC